MKIALIVAGFILVLSSSAYAIPWGVGEQSAAPQGGFSGRGLAYQGFARQAHQRAPLARPGSLLASLSQPCRAAAAAGGPCGCFASEQLLGTNARRNLWGVDAWLRAFPRAAPGPGTAAIWPHRHVAPVVSEPHGGMITVHDSWGTHDVRMAGLIFVRPTQ